MTGLKCNTEALVWGSRSGASSRMRSTSARSSPTALSKASRRRAFDALVDVGGERRVVVRDAELLKVVERVAERRRGSARTRP